MVFFCDFRAFWQVSGCQKPAKFSARDFGARSSGYNILWQGRRQKQAIREHARLALRSFLFIGENWVFTNPCVQYHGKYRLLCTVKPYTNGIDKVEQKVQHVKTSDTVWLCLIHAQRDSGKYCARQQHCEQGWPFGLHLCVSRQVKTRLVVHNPRFVLRAGVCTCLCTQPNVHGK